MSQRQQQRKGETHTQSSHNEYGVPPPRKNSLILGITESQKKKYSSEIKTTPKKEDTPKKDKPKKEDKPKLPPKSKDELEQMKKEVEQLDEQMMEAKQNGDQKEYKSLMFQKNRKIATIKAYEPKYEYEKPKKEEKPQLQSIPKVEKIGNDPKIEITFEPELKNTIDEYMGKETDDTVPEKPTDEKKTPKFNIVLDINQFTHDPNPRNKLSIITTENASIEPQANEQIEQLYNDFVYLRSRIQEVDSEDEAKECIAEYERLQVDIQNNYTILCQSDKDNLYQANEINEELSDSILKLQDHIRPKAKDYPNPVYIIPKPTNEDEIKQFIRMFATPKVHNKPLIKGEKIEKVNAHGIKGQKRVDEMLREEEQRQREEEQKKIEEKIRRETHERINERFLNLHNK